MNTLTIDEGSFTYLVTYNDNGEIFRVVRWYDSTFEPFQLDDLSDQLQNRINQYILDYVRSNCSELHSDE